MSQPAQTIGSMSVAEFAAYDTEGKAELVRGELQLMPSPGARHGAITVDLAMRLGGHVAGHKLGRVFANTGFELLDLPRTVRAPDVAFVRAARLPPRGIGSGLLRMPPDLAIEIRSPSETATRLTEKLDDYRIARVALIWVIDPANRTVTVITLDGSRQLLRDEDLLDGGTLVPGFSCRVADLFEGLDGMTT